MVVLWHFQPTGFRPRKPPLVLSSLLLLAKARRTRTASTGLAVLGVALLAVRTTVSELLLMSRVGMLCRLWCHHSSLRMSPSSEIGSTRKSMLGDCLSNLRAYRSADASLPNGCPVRVPKT